MVMVELFAALLMSIAASLPSARLQPVWLAVALDMVYHQVLETVSPLLLHVLSFWLSNF